MKFSVFLNLNLLGIIALLTWNNSSASRYQPFDFHNIYSSSSVKCILRLENILNVYIFFGEAQTLWIQIYHVLFMTLPDNTYIILA